MIDQSFMIPVFTVFTTFIFHSAHIGGKSWHRQFLLTKIYKVSHIYCPISYCYNQSEIWGTLYNCVFAHFEHGPYINILKISAQKYSSWTNSRLVGRGIQSRGRIFSATFTPIRTYSASFIEQGWTSTSKEKHLRFYVAFYVLGAKWLSRSPSF